MSYPMLVAVGLGAVPASIANNVALAACRPGAALASQSELRGRARWLARWSVGAGAGGGVGAALLLLTPDGIFAHIVPFLVLSGALALALEPSFTRWRMARARREGRRDRPSMSFGVTLFGLSLYNGYFGAGAGVMVLTLMLLVVERDLRGANALKNMLVGAGTILAAVVFLVAGPVRWSAALPLAGGMRIGANLGPRVARHVPVGLLRWVIVVLGIALAAQLWFDPRF